MAVVVALVIPAQVVQEVVAQGEQAVMVIPGLMD